MKPILEQLVMIVLFVMIICYVIGLEIKQRDLEQRIENQKKRIKESSKHTCRNCEHFIIHIGQNKNIPQGFVCDDNLTNCNPGDEKDCFKKRIGTK